MFVSGRRTVMSFHPSTGPETLWRHDHDLPPLVPVVVDGLLMLAENSCITVVDLTDSSRTEITALPPGAACAPVPMANGALFARSDGHLVLVDRGGVQARARLPTRIEQLFTGDGSRAYAIGKALSQMNPDAGGHRDSS